MAEFDYHVIIGLEVHVQLSTRSKLFCGCSTEFRPDLPNTQTCPVCLGLPGALPVMNRKALDLAIQTGLALNCDIAEFTKWDRKQYYYPDLPKAYQISQFDLPFSSHGWLDLPGRDRRIRILRAHLEEDAGKNLHDAGGGNSLVDLNRTGTPLLEIVSEPDLRSAEEARVYLEELRTLLRFLKVSDCNMQEGSLRCDANINLHIPQDDGTTAETPIVELKNMNSFRNVELAIEFEVRRQVKVWKQTGRRLGEVPKQTRGWDAERNQTFAQREKEESSDYRYFPDPDLLPVTRSAESTDAVRAALPETPAGVRKRFATEWELSEYDTGVLLDQGPDFTSWFETVARHCGDGKTAANWATQDVLRELKQRDTTVEAFPISADVMGALLKAQTSGRITNRSAREVYALLLEKSDEQRLQPDDVSIVIAEQGLEVVNDTEAIDAAIRKAMQAQPKAVADVRSGKHAAVGPMIGMVMKQVGGADPKSVRARIIELIESE